MSALWLFLGIVPFLLINCEQKVYPFRIVLFQGDAYYDYSTLPNLLYQAKWLKLHREKPEWELRGYVNGVFPPLQTFARWYVGKFRLELLPNGIDFFIPSAEERLAISLWGEDIKKGIWSEPSASSFAPVREFPLPGNHKWTIQAVEQPKDSLTAIREKNVLNLLFVEQAEFSTLVRWIQNHPWFDLVVGNISLMNEPVQRYETTWIVSLPPAQHRNFSVLEGTYSRGYIQKVIYQDKKISLEVSPAEAEDLLELAKKLGYDTFKGFRYAGVKTCERCHVEQILAWGKTKHAQAYRTLQNLFEDYNPECLPCHTTGWNEGGFSNFQVARAFINVQCEECHGIGLPHLTQPKEAKMRRLPGPEVCLKCHTSKWSPNFRYEEALKRVKH
ncbi:MAG: multiheme c-type cytochrome [bacterium JZ-2024 1]